MRTERERLYEQTWLAGAHYAHATVPFVGSMMTWYKVDGSDVTGLMHHKVYNPPYLPGILLLGHLELSEPEAEALYWKKLCELGGPEKVRAIVEEAYEAGLYRGRREARTAAVKLLQEAADQANVDDRLAGMRG